MPTDALKGFGTSSLTALVPRQVMLEISNTIIREEKVKDKKKDKKKEKKGSSEDQTTDAKQNGGPLLTAGRSALLHSIAAFLNSNGFPRTLEIFLSETQLELEDVKNCSLDLEDILCKVTESRNPFEEKSKYQESAQDCIATAEGTEKFDKLKLTYQVDEVPKKHKKKKRKEQEVSSEMLADAFEKKTGCLGKEDKLNGSLVSSMEMEKNSKSSDALSKEHVKEVDSGKIHEFVEEKLEELRTAIHDKPTADVQGKERKKKKSKSHETDAGAVKSEIEATQKMHDTESGSQPLGNAAVDDSIKQTMNITEPKSKDKKKRKSKAASEDLYVAQKDSVAVQENDKNATGKIKGKDSKKRKKPGTEADDISNGEDNGPLNKKLKNKDDDAKKIAERQGSVEKENAGKPNDSDRQNGLHADNAVNGSTSKKKLEQNGSAEPKKAFQRVKVDEVQFVDERLQDNSYWAKDGAEVGYGAKAQEVLGQVRGRDFRHEKTKKKRGSYRGGQIDLGSHSIKFNYSDDE